MMGFNYLTLTFVTYTLTIGKFLKICFVLFAIDLYEFKLRYLISETSYFMKDYHSPSSFVGITVKDIETFSPTKE